MARDRLGRTIVKTRTRCWVAVFILDDEHELSRSVTVIVEFAGLCMLKETEGIAVESFLETHLILHPALFLRTLSIPLLHLTLE